MICLYTSVTKSEEIIIRIFTVDTQKENKRGGRMRWNKQSIEIHKDILKEFYHFNKYYLEEQMKDSLLDAIECMERVLNEEAL